MIIKSEIKASELHQITSSYYLYFGLKASSEYKLVTFTRYFELIFIRQRNCFILIFIIILIDFLFAIKYTEK